MSREDKRLSGKQWNRPTSNNQEERNKMKSSMPYHRNRSFKDGVWMDIDDLFDDGDDCDYDWDQGFDDSDSDLEAT